MLKVDQFSAVLEGHGGILEKWSDTGEEKQQQRLLPGKLPMGYTQGTGEEHQKKCENSDSLGEDFNSGSGGEKRTEQNHTFLSGEGGSCGKGIVLYTGCYEPVYDILNCGPRNRFVIRGPNKKPIIVHNCVQATAGDFMSHGMVTAEKAGYNIFLTVHDQALAEYHPEKGNTKEGFRKALCDLPSWASDFPLDASAEITPFYTKD
jgi:hypothetical protein